MKKNIFNSLLLLSLLSFLLLTAFSCKDDVVIPPEQQPGRRDYTWTVDTLKPAEGRSLPSRMWGADANDVWAVGLSYLNAYCIWHFDGINWSNYSTDKYIDPRGIWGTSSNNIWIGSTDGAFWHYDGFQWTKFQETTIPNFRQFVVQSMSGKNASDIYAVGYADSIDGNTYKGIIMHFNGSKWELVNVPTIKQSFNQILYDEIADKFVIGSWIFNKPDEFVYSYKANNLNKIFTTQDGVSVNKIGNNIYIAVKNVIYKLNNDTFEKFIDFTSTNYAGSAFGRTEKDFFTINWDGIGHYNGFDLQTIYKKWNNDWFPDGIIVFERDAFVIWDDSYNTFIVHGKLSN